MATNTDIPQGYKATALGIIPQEWEAMRLSDVCTLINGRAYKQNELLSKGKYKILRVGNFFTNDSWYFSDMELDPNKYAYKGDLLYAWSASFGPRFWTGDKVIYHYHIWKICNLKGINQQYLYFFLDYDASLLQRDTQGGTMHHITKENMEKRFIPVPPLAEQRKIAEVLGVWDEAIEKQARLIEKLALRKRALMQRLLSAKLRLPGFSEPWKIHKLQELFTERNETNRTDLPLLSITGDRGVILQTESEKRDTSNDDKSKYKRIAKGDIGYNTMRMWQGRSALSGLEGIVSPAYTIVVPNTDVDGYYMSVLFKQPRLIYDFWTHSQGLVGDTLNCKYRDFGQVHICCPPLAEQKAITEVLTAADREIELAKEKLERLRRQKRGLMQQLLTGKKRI